MALASEVTLKELQDFHSIDRQVYARLVQGLGLDSNHSKKVVAFWNLLERKGFRNFVKKTKPLSSASLYALAKEAVMCLRCLYCLRQESFQRVKIDVPLTSSLVTQEISVSYILGDIESAKSTIEEFVNNICRKAFKNIVPKDSAEGVQIQSSSCIEEFKCPFSEGKGIGLLSEQLMMPGPTSKVVGGNSNTVSKENRTLFVTFSRGYPISKQELKALITRKFGNCIEAVYMQQPLFARVILHSSSDITEIMGDEKLVKFSTKGKDVWARRLIPKRKKQKQIVTDKQPR